MGRLGHFYGNAGFWGVLRFVIVGGAFVSIGVFMLVKEGQPGPLIVLVAGAAVPVLGRRWIVAEPERSSRIARGIGYGLFAASFLSGLVKERLMAVVAPELLFGALGFVVALYLGVYAVLFSDPSIRRVR